MPYKDPNSKAAKECAKRASAKYWIKHKERLSEKKKEKYNNDEELKQYHKDFHKQPRQVKLRIIRSWKRIGVKHDDYDELYELYDAMTYCMNCGENFDKRINKHLDHNHETGEVRMILCRSCNLSERHIN